MYAFVEAALAGTDVLEMDLQMTADGVLVVHHDATVDRRTETTGRVRDLTVVELQELDKAYWFHDRGEERDLPDDQYPFRGMRTGDVEPPAGYTADDFKIETFRTLAETFPDHVLDLEIKVRSTMTVKATSPTRSRPPGYSPLRSRNSTGPIR